MDRRTFVALAAGAGGACGQTGATMLADHRIATITAATLRDRYPRTVGRNSHLGSHGNGGSYQVRRLTTDQGATGWGMSHGPADQVRRFVGTRLSDLFSVTEGAAPEALAAGLDLPLWDLAGQILRQPVWQMLGAAGPTALPIYSGAIYMDDLDPDDRPRGVAAVLANCRQDRQAGYRAFKLKIGRGYKWLPGEAGVRRDIEVTRAVREAFPDCRLLVDANDGYTPESFAQYLRAVADCDLYWIEEPFEESVEGYRLLRGVMAETGCRALLADGETRRDRRESPGEYGGYTEAFIDRLYQLAAERLLDVALIDLGIVGFSRWRKVLPRLQAGGLQASPHTWGWVPRPYYAAQLAAGCGNVVIVEGIPGRTEGLDYGAWRLTDGLLHVADAPGFGIRWDGPR